MNGHRGFLALTTALLAALLLFACGQSSRRETTAVPHGATIDLSNALAELDAMQPPEGVDATVFGQLKEALRAALLARNQTRIACTPPTGPANAVPDLAITDNGDGTANLTWRYYNLGDYNQDGTVGIADITPLAMHFGQSWITGEEYTLPAVVDGSANGTVDIADVTPIAMNFGVEVDTYAIEASATSGSGFSLLIEQGLGTGMDAGTKRMRFSYTFTPIPNYWYRVVPHDSAGAAGALSNEVQAPAAGTPTAPTGLAAVAVGATKASLTWADNSSDELGFRIERKEGVAGTWAEVATTPPDTPLYIDTGLTPETTYYYRVCAYNAAGNSAYTNEDDATTSAPVTPPDAPSNLVAAVYNSTQINLTWTDNSTNEDRFKIERKEGAAGTWAEIVQPFADATSYPNTGLTPSTEYYYRILAYNTGGDSAWSNEASATTSADTSPWVHTFGDSLDDVANAVDVDSGGNVYTVGTTDNFSAGSTDILVQKYSTLGVPLWRKTWGDSGTEEGYGICVDSADEVYVVGSSDSFGIGSDDAFLLKYAGDGTLLWKKTWDSAGADYASSVAADNLGFIYVAGYTNGTGAGLYDLFLLKYSSAGALQWQKTWGGTSDDYAYAVAVDSSGNIAVAGQTNSFGVSGDYIVLRYSSDGTLLWQKTWGGAASESALAVGVSSSGNIYAAGYTYGYGAGMAEVGLIMYTTSGYLFSQVTWGGSLSDIPQALSVSAVGNVYLAGKTNSFGAGDDDLFLLEYSAGTLVVQKAWGDSDAEAAKGICVDVTGLAYVAGYAANSSGSWYTPLSTVTVPSATDGVPSGTEGTPAGTDSTPGGIESIPASGVEDTGGGGYDTLVMRFDPFLI